MGIRSFSLLSLICCAITTLYFSSDSFDPGEEAATRTSHVLITHTGRGTDHPTDRSILHPGASLTRSIT